MDSHRVEVRRKFSLVRRREVSDRLGFVADFCIVCGTVRAFKAVSVSTVPTILGVPFGLRSFLRNQIECRICRVKLPKDPEDYARVLSAPTRSIEKLIELTNPSVLETMRERIEWERIVEVAPRTLPEDVRKQLLTEIFQAAAPHFEQGHGTEGRRMLSLRLPKLQPTEEEIRDRLQEFRARNEKIAIKLRTASVMRLVGG